jgi:hypothetical protein
MRVAMYLDRTWRGRLMEAFDWSFRDGSFKIAESR